ncbi:Toluene efflux pump periplasmic linker protein TtgD [Dyadobacter sp. CECT 9275]|uniref:Toluene efflux pump periplasmic linker protein TtgD n=1 Tax=Dyadobacter helix TaxID=2822344 RepID=A0A916JAB7_9BACT|nr:efflux RND transporter periplasmic adaptor subunit [Dyadobacter sp. CECT 9275]CAG4998073.1 Toluene efflux pump periplasmic linker protein TtgD [Dyadobacter sp. CECT 9275]
MNIIKTIGFVGLVITVSVTLQNCGSSKAEEEEKKKPEASVMELETYTLKKGEMTSELKIPGELVAFQQVDLYAKVNSFVRKLYVDVGSEVSQGQLLASMEAPELNAQLAGTESRLKSQEAVFLASKANYERLLETSKTPGTVSQNDLDMAYAKQQSDLSMLEAAKSARKEVSDNKNYLEIRAPFSGTISARNVSTGAYVGPSGKGSELPLFTLVEQKKLRLVVSVPEAYTGYLKNKSQVSFSVKSYPDQKFSASVSRLSGALDNRLRSQRTEMDISNTDKKLLPGMIAEVSISLDNGTDKIAVPRKAVLNSTKGVFIIKIVNGKAQWVPVKTGRSTEEQTEIYGDVQEGDVIVKTSAEEIRDGSNVKIKAQAN